MNLVYFRRITDMEEMSISEIPTISKIDNIKEDFAKVLTDWQEHIGYLQVLLISYNVIYYFYAMSSLLAILLGHGYG